MGNGGYSGRQWEGSLLIPPLPPVTMPCHWSSSVGRQSSLSGGRHKHGDDGDGHHYCAQPTKYLETTFNDEPSHDV